MTSSIELLYHGSAEEFVDSLATEIKQHPALNHPFLSRLGNGEYANVQEVLKDYAHQYSIYSEWFTRYLDGVLSNLSDPSHTAAIMENMEEEKGNPNSDRLEERPHVELFQMFKNQIGADAAYCAANPPCTTVLLWRDLFLQKCNSSIPGVGLAAIGMGTEYIISTIYPNIIEAIENHTDLGEEGSLFFRLHVDCDDGHAEVVRQITQQVAEDIANREAIRFGVFSSLNLRKAFWDTQLARAIDL